MAVTPIHGFAGVEAAIRRAAGATGVDFDFLLRTARRESGLNANARAPTSSAAGLFQFVDQTWLGALKRYGPKYGLGNLAELIQKGPDGRLHVADPAARRAVMNLKLDPQTASLMAGELTADHAAYLKGRTGRVPSAGDLYAAHFLGPQGSAKLIEAMGSRPSAAAASLFPEAAGANRSIFFHGGRPATVAELYANLSRQAGAGGAAAPQDAVEPSDSGFLYADRLDHLKRDRELLDLFTGKNKLGGGSLVDAQLLGAFGPEAEKG